MPAEVETVVRETFVSSVAAGCGAAELDPDADMDGVYGLTSLNKVLFLTTACERAGVPLTSLTEADLAAMQTLRQVVEKLSLHVPEVRR